MQAIGQALGVPNQHPLLSGAASNTRRRAHSRAHRGAADAGTEARTINTTTTIAVSSRDSGGETGSNSPTNSMKDDDDSDDDNDGISADAAAAGSGGVENEEGPLCLFRIFHYPPHEETEFGADTWAVGKHSDYGFLTLLLQDSSGGLEVQRRRGTSNGTEGAGSANPQVASDEVGSQESGRVGSQSRQGEEEEEEEEEWVDVPFVPGSIVVNLGDALEHLTGGLLRATPHR